MENTVFDHLSSILKDSAIDSSPASRLMLASMPQPKTTFGLTLSNRAVLTRGMQPRDLIEMAIKAERSSAIEAVWVGDSILSKPRLECIPLLGAIAGQTSRLRLGVACMATIAQRNPVLLALQWASLDVLSGGRTWLAACMGYPARQHPMAAKELEVMGIASKERPGRLEEMIQALRILWSNPQATFHGKYYSFEDVDLVPKPVQQPCPIYIAGTPRARSLGEHGVERALRRIARYADGWMTNQIEPHMFRDYLPRLRQLLTEEGRDPNTFKTVLYYGICVNSDKERAFREAKSFLDAYYLKDFTREGVEIWNACGPLDHCISCLQPFMEAGVDHITIRPIGENLPEQLRIYLDEFLPAVSSLKHPN
jgi:alkanesulfonate monooxygenase SsuD/methylene tetrahydromethanopterin reductase-like flavin-dependent oxidoreductase (luciferase family)